MSLKRKILLPVLLLLLFHVPVHSQVPADFPSLAASWNVEFYLSPDPSLPIEYYYYRYFLNGDTLLNGHTYAKLYEAPTNTALIDTANASYIGAIREDTAQKVWFLGSGPQFYAPYCDYPSSSSEQLLYDFGIAVGDVVNLPTSYAAYTVNAVDTININGTLRRRWTISKDGCQGCEYWVEGVGSTRGLFYPWCEMFEWDWTLLCFEDNDIFYQPLGTGTDCYPFVSVEDPLSMARVEASPNPASDVLRFDLNPATDQACLFEVVDLNGRAVYSESFSGEQEIVLSTAALPKGVYYYSVSSEGRRLSSGKVLLQ